MKTPVDLKIIDSIKISLYHLNDKEEYQLNVIKLALKSSVFTCDQLFLIINEINNREFMLAIITLIYPNIIDRKNFQNVYKYLESQREKEILERLIHKNYYENKQKLLKLKSSQLIDCDDIDYAELQKNQNYYIEKLKGDKSLLTNSDYDEIFDSFKIQNTKKLNNTDTGNTNNTDISYNSILISNEHLNSFLKSSNVKDQINSRKKLSELRSFVNNNFLSVSQCLKIISHFANEDEMRTEFVLAVYPVIYDPQNIEYLIREIESDIIQNSLRIKLIDLPNFSFGILENNTAHCGCCCNIF